MRLETTEALDANGAERKTLMAGHARALVLSGGGARGAYEAGVIGYIWRLLGRHFQGHHPFQIVSGTSVGAINTVSLAATAHEPLTQGEVLIGHWRSLEGNELLRLSLGSIAQFGRWVVGSSFPALRKVMNIERGSLLDTRPLQLFVRDAVHWPQVQRNIDSGCVESVSISCTELTTGRTRVFVATRRRQLPVWSRDSMVQAQRCVLRPEHALASASIPILFPAVPIEGRYYCDGGLRQNTPLSPALRLGADRVLVIGIRRQGDTAAAPPGEPYPSPMFLAGKIIDAMLLDRIDYDIDRLNLINDLLATGHRVLGAQFGAAVNETAERWRGAPYKPVQCLYIRPSRDIGAIALECIKGGHVQATGFTKRMIRRVAEAESDYAADLMSYLLFDRPFAERLIALGFEDAHRQREAIIDFFDDRDVGGERPQVEEEAALEELEGRRMGG